MSELNQLWADGVLLSELFASVLKDTPIDEEEVSKLPPKDTPVDPANTWASFGYTMAYIRLDQERRDRAIDKLRRSFVAGRKRAIGRRWIDDHTANLVEITDWLSAEFSPEMNKVATGGIKFDLVRTFETAPQSENYAPSSKTSRGPGRPSSRKEIRAAIEHFASAVDWFTANAPAIRQSTYRRYIKAQFRIDTIKVDGFDVKTLEKYETEYRQETGR